MHNLQLGTNFENWKIFWIRRHDPRFVAFAQKVFERDHFTCQYCAFKANKHLEVVNVDGDYRNNKSNNVLTACPFCAQCFFLESIGVGAFGGGTLIYLPEFSQAQLNALCHVFFQMIEKGDVLSSDAESILRDLKFRAMLLEK